ncbi:hypothetical protein BCY91_10285 [Pelobium manganitolerans]|uniref:tRNA (5-methylaminomethyl-2-thiouridylate)-methyltransferase n=1 Tax=Pelobium manganitolerans TaxID=1842495 RepID=A0A419S2V9_9SPHI|nr:hypothetical protein [Pelobium manganitolerans]RKD13203.1 hypothetical protein BCY91_10285 [Pelobium manganitolerans]
METLALNDKIKTTYNLLYIVFVVVPIVAGIDKFTNLLVQWDQYINPAILGLLPFSAHTFMMIVGVIEIVAGIIVWKKASVGGYIVAAWLASIAITLIFSLHFLDVAVRDLVMAIGAFSMANLARALKL